MFRASVGLVASVVAGCASVQSAVDVTGAPGAPGRGPVPVYYALAPDFPTREVGVIEAHGRGATAHLEDLLEEAERRAQQLGADAVILRELRTTAHLVPHTEFRPCGRGTGGMSMAFTCPTIVSVLEVEMHLRATAVRRGLEEASVPAPWSASGGAQPWAPPPPPPPSESP
jgi:hypothetical protein